MLSKIAYFHENQDTVRIMNHHLEHKLQFLFRLSNTMQIVRYRRYYNIPKNIKFPENC